MSKPPSRPQHEVRDPEEPRSARRGRGGSPLSRAIDIPPPRHPDLSELWQKLFPEAGDRLDAIGFVYEQASSDFISLCNGTNISLSERRQVLERMLADLAPTHDEIFDVYFHDRDNALPMKAPQLWEDRKSTENPVAFTSRVYGAWIGKGMTRKKLRDLDPALYRALSVWEHRHPDDVIKGLPTLAEVIDERIARLSSELNEDELRKLGSTLQTRHRRSKK